MRLFLLRAGTVAGQPLAYSYLDEANLVVIEHLAPKSLTEPFQ